MVVGITGTFCSGKNVACSIFRENGYYIIDVDRIGHEALAVKKTEVLKAFGLEILCFNGDVNRGKLGKLVFSSPEAKKKLESIVHPWMIKKVKNEVRIRGDVVINAALLIEMCLFILCDFVLAIDVEEKVAIKRAFERDGLNPDEAVARIRSQIPIKEKLHFVDKIIDNNGTLKDFKQEVQKIIWQLQSKVD